MFEIERVCPEQVGIPSESINRFIKSLKDSKMPLHSLLIARHGKIAAEAYCAPYDKCTLQRMFSVTKSFTSLAIGLLEADGLIKLSDPICQYFKEYLPGKVHPWLAQMTIEDMLQMRTCYNMTTYNKTSTTENWVKSFFQTEPTHRPGTIFMYDTSSSHTLCALVEKLTKKDMLSYLKDRVFRQIGFSENSYIIKDPFGTSIGGSGLMACPEDLLRVGLLLLNDGKDPAFYHTGKGDQIYPLEYIKKATSSQVSPMLRCTDKDRYGYMIWGLPNDGFGFLGLGEQLLMCYPKQDLIVVITADTQGMQGIGNIISENIQLNLLDSLYDSILNANPSQAELLQDNLKSLNLIVPTNDLPADSMKYSNKMYDLELNKNDFKNIGIELNANGGILKYTLRGELCEIPFGYGHLQKCLFPGYNQKTVSSGVWLDSQTLLITCWLVDSSVASVTFKLFYKDDTLTVLMAKTEETMFCEYQGFLNS